MDELRRLPIGALLDHMDKSEEPVLQLQFQSAIDADGQFVGIALFRGDDGKRHSDKLNEIMRKEAQRQVEMQQRQERRDRKRAGRVEREPISDDSKGG